MGLAIFWHRRDLRIEDNAGLFYALKQTEAVQPIFIFDTTILSQLPKNDQRVIFIYEQIKKLKEEYRKFGTDLKVYHGNPIELIPTIVEELNAVRLIANRDYEPSAILRDKTIYDYFAKKNIPFLGYKDQVLFEKNEVLKQDGTPYTVFTPYARKWKEKLNDFYTSPYPVEKYIDRLLITKQESPLVTLKELGFSDQTTVEFPAASFDGETIKYYHLQRDFPAMDKTTRLSVHLRFGTISIRKLVTETKSLNETFLNELIWRDFYQMILFHFPHSVNESFKKQYDHILWENDEVKFKAWCEGKTGYPIVDAGMRELNATGFMHNRVRMIVASFLTKHLLIDWRWGEAYFGLKLLDYEQASNVGGWQWAASSGCDAVPYFRIFNPGSQQEKYDREAIYIKKWVPEYGTSLYPEPIVEHKDAREKALKTFKTALG